MDEEDLLFYAALAAVGYLVLRSFGKDLFEPTGTTKQGLANMAARSGSTVNTQADRTFITVGDTTYGIRDTDLENTGFIKRRLALASMLGNPEWAVKWAYS